MAPSTLASAEALARLAGRIGAVSVVRSARGGYDILAGSVTLSGVSLVALVAFGRDVLAHLDTRTAGVRVSVPADDAFPASAALVHDGVSLRLLDDGDLVTVMAFSGTDKGGAGTDKGGAGTGVRLDDVRSFARTLASLA